MGPLVNPGSVYATPIDSPFSEKASVPLFMFK